MESTINVRRVLVSSLIGATLVVALSLTSGCGAGFANQRSRTVVEHDDGVAPVKRISVTHEGNAQGASVGMPFMGGGLGMVGGYGSPIVGGGGLCTVHPDYCGTTVTVMSPPVASAPGYGPSDLEGRVANNERKIGALGGAYRDLVDEGRKTRARVNEVDKKLDVVIRVAGQSYRLDRAQCLHLQSNPGMLSGEAATKATAACNEILGADVAAEEGASDEE